MAALARHSLVSESRTRLLALAGGAAGIMEYLCAGIVQQGDLVVKVRLARQFWLLAQCVDQIVTRLPGLKDPHARSEPNLPRPAWWPDPALADRVVPRLLGSLGGKVNEVIARSAPLADEPTLAALDTVARLVAQASALDAAEGEAPGRSDQDSQPLGDVDLADWPWSQLSSAARGCALPDVPGRPAREADFPDDAGYRGPSLARDLANRVEYLHSVALGVEICAVEACAAMIAGNQDVPWALRRDLARQLHDEARYYRLFESRIQELGGRIGSYPADLVVWDRFRLGSSIV